MPFKQPDAGFSAWAGQAAWADPATDHTCRECIFWSRPGERVARSQSKYFGNTHELKPRQCALARRLNAEISAAVPHSAQACQHFSPNAAPPAIWAKHSRRVAKQPVSEFPTLCRRAPRLRYSPHVEGSYYHVCDDFKTTGSA